MYMSSCSRTAREVRGAREDALLVEEVRLGHRDRARRGVVGAGAHELDDLAAAAAGAIDDRVEALLGDELR
jgi:hypothetical protein